jgi:predicted TIM-barrel fold metal-dependent hydrolase
MGEVNLIKQALFGNLAQPADLGDIIAWRPFMDELLRRGMPITIHSDLGNDAEPLKYLYLMEAALSLYPENKIIWPHMGLSNEQKKMDPALHIEVLRRLMDEHPNLYLDISWRVLQDSYFSNESIRNQYVPFFDQYSARIIPGTDFVASRTKDFAVYAEELDVTSQINKYLNDKAFRDIALGQSYFDLLGLPERAPEVCPE